MRTASGIYVEDLSDKQFNLLWSLCKEFQPYTSFKEVVFLEVVTAARTFCDGSVYPFCGKVDDGFSEESRFNKLFINRLMKDIKNKFYFNGLKYSKRPLTDEQRRIMVEYVPKVKLPNFGLYLKHSSAEKDLFMKLVRACRDFMRAKMSKEAEQMMFERLRVVYDAMAS